jgi:NAD(P)-dependent dehydrogenase (short-subunit alcohol dehydrogenase family)
VGGKVALVSGAGAGIGKAAALLLAQEGAAVVVTDRDQAAAAETARAILSAGGKALVYALDVTVEDEWQATIAQVLDIWERLDILVNNAGVSFGKPVTEMTLAEWQMVMTVNAGGVFLGTKYAIPAMQQSGGGSIINLASASGLKASAGASAYCSSKAAVRLFSKAAALECAQGNPPIRVNCVLPGGVMTPMWESMEFWQELAAGEGGADAAWQALSQDVPLKRFAHPDEIAQAILYLASDESRYVTGSELVIDGGYTA